MLGEPISARTREPSHRCYLPVAEDFGREALLVWSADYDAQSAPHLVLLLVIKALNGLRMHPTKL